MQVCLPIVAAENWKPATKTDQVTNYLNEKFGESAIFSSNIYVNFSSFRFEYYEDKLAA